MAKIKKVILHNKKLLSCLVPHTGYDFFTTGFAPFPFDAVNFILPLRFKFFQDAYLIMENKEVKGFVSLEVEKGSKYRINISKFFLNENSLEYGEQLINYVTSRYSAIGATSFNIKFDSTYEKLINLLINNCKFRVSSQEKIYKIENIKNTEGTLNYFYSFSNHDAQSVLELVNSCINGYQRGTFGKSEGHFRENLINELDSKTMFKYIFKADDKDDIRGYFSIFSLDNKNYIVDLILDPAYNPYFIDIMSFCSREIQKRKKNFSIYLRLNQCFMNFGELDEIARQEEGFEFLKQNIILTKDFYVPIKEGEKNKVVFFDALNLNAN